MICDQWQNYNMHNVRSILGEGYKFNKRIMGKNKDRQRMIEQARLQRRQDKEMKMKLRKKMGKGDAFKLTKDYCEYFSAFNKEITPLKLMLKDVAGDGNCLFRSFADQIDGNETSHVFMRDEACNFMGKNEQFFRPFLDEDEEGTFENYLKAMRKNGQWGGHLQLQALSECFKCVIVVHKRGLEEFNVRPISEQVKQIVHLGYFQHEDFEHYVSIRLLNDQSDLPALRGLHDINNKTYRYLLFDDPEEYLLRQFQEMQIKQQFQEMQIKQQQQNQQQQDRVEEQPFPNYPRNKKCKCGSKIQYRSCCFKQWQRRLSKRQRNQ